VKGNYKDEDSFLSDLERTVCEEKDDEAEFQGMIFNLKMRDEEVGKKKQNKRREMGILMGMEMKIWRTVQTSF
jgi:hypothetical protein